MTEPQDGDTIYDRHGDSLGSIHYSPRSRRWYTKTGRALSPAFFFDAQQAADSLRGVRVDDTAGRVL